MISRTFLLSILILSFYGGLAQSIDYHGQFIKLGGAYHELKDALNHGLVFRGPDINITYGLQHIDEERSFEYAIGIGGGGKTAAASWGFRWKLSPLHAHYAWNIVKQERFRVYLGPSVQVNYQVYTYPELHAGPIIWMADYDLGVHLSGIFQLKGKWMEVRLQTNAFGWYSRPDVERDPYYFSTQIGENFKDIHSNLVFGSPSTFNRTSLGARIFLDGKNRRKAIGYSLVYQGYYDAPRFEEVSHMLSYTWFLRNK